MPDTDPERDIPGVDDRPGGTAASLRENTKSNEGIAVVNSRNSSSTGFFSKEFLSDRTVSLQDLIVQITTALITNGFPSHRLETVVNSLGEALGIPTTVYFLNSHCIVQFPPLSKRGPPAVYPIAKRGSMNFTRLPELVVLVKKIIREPAQNDVTEITAELERIAALKNAFSELAIAVSYIFAAGTSAIMFFSGTWRDAGMSAALAIIPASLLLVANRYSALWWTNECIACFIISIVATLVSEHFCYSTLILSAPVTLLPGHTISVSVVEIMTKNTIAGCIRLVYTLVYLMCMVLGFTLAPMLINAPVNTSGIGFQRFPTDMDKMCPTQSGVIMENELWLLLCVPVYICAYNVYLKTPWKQWPSMIIIGSLGYAAGFASKHIWHAPPEFNAFAASFTIGVSANIYAKYTDNFVFNAIVAGVFIQVPGSWGIRGLLKLAYAQYDDGLYWCYSTLAICVSMSAALYAFIPRIFFMDIS
ncbi:pheromone-regulated protein prm10 [Rhizina undulata]